DGLGPTSDDLTNPSIAKIVGRRMILDEEIAASLERRWRARFPEGRFPATNRSQAEIPEGADILTNRHGSAPGIWLQDEKARWVAMIPGVPREMRGLLAEEVLPRILALYGDADTAVISGTVRTTGIAESAIAEMLGPDFLRESGSGLDSLSLAYLPGVPGVDLRVTARGMPRQMAEALVQQAVVKLRERVSAYVYGEGESDLAAGVFEQRLR